jgi:hypothetical protein
MHSTRFIVDRGLCIVLSVIMGATLFVAEACSGDRLPGRTGAGHPPARGHQDGSVGRTPATPRGAETGHRAPWLRGQNDCVVQERAEPPPAAVIG